MPYEIQELRPARTVTPEVIELAAAGCRRSREFIEEWGETNRAFLQSLVSPFVPDEFQGRSWLAQWSAAPVRVLPSARIRDVKRPERDRRLYQEWNRILAKFGLSDEQLGGSSGKQVVIIPRGDEPPLKTVDADFQLQSRHGITWRSAHAVPIQIHEREVPEWTQSDAAS